MFVHWISLRILGPHNMWISFRPIHDYQPTFRFRVFKMPRVRVFSLSQPKAFCYHNAESSVALFCACVCACHILICTCMWFISDNAVGVLSNRLYRFHINLVMERILIACSIVVRAQNVLPFSQNRTNRSDEIPGCAWVIAYADQSVRVIIDDDAFRVAMYETWSWSLPMHRWFFLVYIWMLSRSLAGYDEITSAARECDCYEYFSIVQRSKSFGYVCWRLRRCEANKITQISCVYVDCNCIFETTHI